jgi:hypothetical protein
VAYVRSLVLVGKFWHPENKRSIFNCGHNIFKTSFQFHSRKNYFTWKWPWYRSHVRSVTWYRRIIRTVDTASDWLIANLGTLMVWNSEKLDHRVHLSRLVKSLKYSVYSWIEAIICEGYRNITRSSQVCRTCTRYCFVNFISLFILFINRKSQF